MVSHKRFCLGLGESLEMILENFETSPLNSRCSCGVLGYSMLISCKSIVFHHNDCKNAGNIFIPSPVKMTNRYSCIVTNRYALITEERQATPSEDLT